MYTVSDSWLQVCEQLGIIEKDYFGLIYKASRGEYLWLNLRNRIDRQMLGQPPYRLFLRVKFFVPPHDLLFPETRCVQIMKLLSNCTFGSKMLVINKQFNK